MAETKPKEKKVLSMRDIAKKLNKASTTGSFILSGDPSASLTKLPSKSLSFDLPLNGGLPDGCFVTFCGPEGSLKSSVACLMMARYQQKHPDKVCLYVDAENTLITMGAHLHEMTGISFDESVFLRYDCTGRTAEEILGDVLQFQASDDVGMIIIDSARTLIPKAELEEDFEKDNGQRASVSKTMGKFIKQMIMYLPKRNNILLIINHVTITKTMFSTTYEEPCGYSLKYWPSLKIRFKPYTYTLGEKTDLTPSKAKDVDGVQAQYVITKSRISDRVNIGGHITFRKDGGQDLVYDLIDPAITAKFIQQPNNQTYVLCNPATGEVLTDKETKEDLSFRGKEKLVAYLKSHKEFTEQYIDMITEYISQNKIAVNLLDEESLNAILAEEKGVMEGIDTRNMTDEDIDKADGLTEDDMPNE